MRIPQATRIEIIEDYIAGGIQIPALSNKYSITHQAISYIIAKYFSKPLQTLTHDDITAIYRNYRKRPGGYKRNRAEPRLVKRAGVHGGYAEYMSVEQGGRMVLGYRACDMA